MVQDKNPAQRPRLTSSMFRQMYLFCAVLITGGVVLLVFGVQSSSSRGAVGAVCGGIALLIGLAMLVGAFVKRRQT